ncbi:hypothetical protein [Lentibacillus jeotgali]|uniref:hypothetical protein n=1 Tax=Lentibacillus jeotgali TaxID=558169 RepID=UPI0002628818|nr:hypothetical protein [Lentibacillus jeotgali]
MLKNTGERIIPEYMKTTDEQLIEHMARYFFALEYVHGRIKKPVRPIWTLRL